MSTHPFKNSVQYTAYLLLGCLLVGRILMRPVPRTKIQIQKNQMMVETPPAKVDMKSLFKSRGYCYLTAGLCFACLGVFFPSFYLQVCPLTVLYHLHMVPSSSDRLDWADYGGRSSLLKKGWKRIWRRTLSLLSMQLPQSVSPFFFLSLHVIPPPIL